MAEKENKNLENVNQEDVKQEDVNTSEEKEKTQEELVQEEEQKLHESKEFQMAVQNVALIMKDLLSVQAEVNAKVQEKLGDYKPTMANYILAYNVELYELINEIAVWKWWKEHNQPNKEKVLDELADCFAFMLSSFSLLEGEQQDKVIMQFAYIYWDLKVHMDPNCDHKQQAINIVENIGIASELSGTDHISTMQTFALVILAVEFLFDFEVDWDDFTYYYKKKSKVNIKRQEENY